MEKILLTMMSFIVILTILSSLLYIATPSFIIKEEKTPVEKPIFEPIETNVSKRSIRMVVPAVDSEGNGVTATLQATLVPGEGRALANVNQILFWVDTQHSIRTALRVAENITGISIKNYDMIYSIETNASIIEGPSAGAALTILTVAALENKTLNASVMITGTINHDGTIGPVSQIIEKAEVAKNNDVTLFLVPIGQGIQTTYKEEKHCERYGFVEFCTTELKPEKISVGEKVGIDIKEVSTIQEALKYFLID